AFTSPPATERGPVLLAKACCGAKEGVVAPAAVVFSSTDTVPLPLLATRRSGRPSPLTSPTATEYGLVPVGKVCWGAKEGVVAPAAVVFNSTDTEMGRASGRGRAERPSRVTSPNGTEMGWERVAKACVGAKEWVVARAAVVCNSTDAVPRAQSATRRSGRPSPLTSPTATEMGWVPVAKVCWGAKEGVVAPAAVVFNSTDT